MQNKNFLFFSIAILFSGNAVVAQVKEKMNIASATVFLHGAELQSEARLTLAKGENEILLTNVAGDVNTQSLSVGATNDVVVESATFQNNYLQSDNLSPSAKMIKDSIDVLTDESQAIGNKIKVLNLEITLLDNTKKDSGARAVSVAELQKLLDLVNARMEGYLSQKNKDKAVQKKLDDRIANLNKQLDEEQKKAYQPGGQILVKFFAKEATSTDIAVTYITPNAGWAPTYDIIADHINNPVKLYYKANVYQNCGVKWDNVKLNLSTGNPNEGAQAPTINPWYLAFYMPMPRRMMAPMAAGSAMVSGYDKTLEKKDEMVEQSALNEYVSVDNSGINTSFDIDLPYTIPSDGQQHIVSVKKYELPAAYCYYAVPKLDKDAFLQARITNWEDLDLLPATTNIFYEGTYIGQGYIDPHSVNDTMMISLGRDKKIIVKRDEDKNLRSVKTIGSNVRETYAYTVSVRNTRKENIDLIIQDQLPVSNDKDIVIEDKETGGANYDETTGALKWTMQLNASETKKLAFGYTIKYPKGKQLANK